MTTILARTHARSTFAAGFLFSLFLLAVSLTAAGLQAQEPISRIAFGSCAHQGLPQPIWDAVVAQKPEMFLFIGDNIYGDSRDMRVLQEKWDLLAAQPGYQRLKAACPVLATWDDHDYGENDAGVEYPKKRESQKIFLDFFDEPEDSPRRQREGVYDAKMFGPEGQRVQIILLDTRYFRSPLVPRKPRETKSPDGRPGVYDPNNDPQSTVLGAAQWKWLEEQFRQPAQLRVIASSIQVIPDEHGWEKWGNFPHERQRLLDLIRKTRACGVVLISGDRHSAEISQLDGVVGYPLVDVTSSSLNRPALWHNERNPHRLGSKYTDTNFGTILIDWNAEDPLVKMQVHSEDGKVVLRQQLKLSQLQPKN